MGLANRKKGPVGSRSVAGGFPTKASFTTALTGANNDLVFTAAATGVAGNSTRISYVVAGASTPLTVTVSGSDITVNVATDAVSAATSTAAQVSAAVAAATALVSSANAPGNTGAGVVAALAYTSLAGGSAWVIGSGK